VKRCPSIAAEPLAPLSSMSTTPPEPSLIDFPCAFPIKVMGAQVDGFVEAMVHVARHFDPGFDAASIERRPSRAGNYLGLTLTVNATSREQLDELYRTLSSHPMVKVVL
jgi:putative lipoic acid-binding regulatory protein